MKTRFRNVVLAIIWAGLSLGAQASPVSSPLTVTFESLLNDITVPDPDKPVDVGSKINGFEFEGATAYTDDLLAVYNLPEPGGDSDGDPIKDSKVFVQSLRDPSANTFVNSIFVTLAGPNKDEAIVALDFFGAVFGSNPTKLEVFAWGRGASAGTAIGQTLNADGLFNWGKSSGPIDPKLDTNRIEFKASGLKPNGDPSDEILFSLDTMTFTFAPRDPGGNVPEPESLALVAMAMFAAWAATRRRTRVLTPLEA